MTRVLLRPASRTRWAGALAIVLVFCVQALLMYEYHQHHQGCQPEALSLVGHEVRAAPAAALSVQTAQLPEERAAVVRAGMLHAWKSYERYALGSDELHPVSKSSKSSVLGGLGVPGASVSIIDALSTLHVLGLTDEFQRARDWVSGSLNLEATRKASFFETVIRVLGGLVSAYDLSGDAMFLQKAQQLGDKLMRNFEATSTGLAWGDACLLDMCERLRTPGATQNNLAELGSNLLEFGALSLRTGNPKYQQKAERGIVFMHEQNPNQALLSKHVFVETGKPVNDGYSVGAEADSYFEYLLKYWILTGKQEDQWRQRWEQAVDEVLDKLWVKPRGQPFGFASDLSGGSHTHIVHHLACFWPGNMALGAMQGAVTGEKAERYLAAAKDMTHACYQLYNLTSTGLGAEQISFSSGQPSVVMRMYFQRPEVIESIFYLFRATKDDMYREWGWKMFSAIEKHCRVDGGYSGVTDVMQVPPHLDDTQQSWFLAETLKYFYLLFAPESTLSLSEWVFNTEAHPLKATRAGDRPAPEATV